MTLPDVDEAPHLIIFFFEKNVNMSENQTLAWKLAPADITVCKGDNLVFMDDDGATKAPAEVVLEAFKEFLETQAQRERMVKAVLSINRTNEWINENSEKIARGIITNSKDKFLGSSLLENEPAYDEELEKSLSDPELEIYDTKDLDGFDFSTLSLPCNAEATLRNFLADVTFEHSPSS